MKQRLKNYLKLGILLFGISFVLINCQKEEGFEEQTQTNELLMNYKEITFNDFKSKNSANHSLLNKSILKSNNASVAFRGPNESNTYSIDSTNIVSIEHVNGYSSYTFLVTSTTEPNLIQNIFISNAIDGTTAIYLLEYDTDIPVNEIDDATLDEHIIQKTIYDLENPNFDYQNRGDILVCYDLTTTTVFQCDNGDLVTESNHPECFKNGQNIGRVTIITVSTVCETVSGGGGGNGDVTDPTDTEGNNSSGGGGGNGESVGNQGDNTDQNTPCQENGTSTSFNDGNGKCIDGITAVIKEVENQDDCVNQIFGLSEIVNTPKIKTELRRLKFNMVFSTKEDGRRFIYTGTNPSDPTTYSDANFTEQLPTDKLSGSLEFPPLQNNTLVAAHFHPAFLFPTTVPIGKIPSGTDIAEHINMIKKMAQTNLLAANQVTNFIISGNSSGRTYVLRVNDVQSIIDNTKNYRRKKNRDEIRDDVLKITETLDSDADDEHETAITQFLADNFPALDLFKAEYDSDGNITRFCKLKTQ